MYVLYVLDKVILVLRTYGTLEVLRCYANTAPMNNRKQLGDKLSITNVILNTLGVGPVKNGGHHTAATFCYAISSNHVTLPDNLFIYLFIYLQTSAMDPYMWIKEFQQKLLDICLRAHPNARSVDPLPMNSLTSLGCSTSACI